MQKKGFTVPVNDWLNYPKINKRMRDLTYSLPKEFINQNFLDKLWNDLKIQMEIKLINYGL